MVAETINIKNKALLKDQCYINGEWMGANDGSSSEVTNPANSERLGSLPNCGADETILAITAANEAQKIWAKTDAKELQMAERERKLAAEKMAVQQDRQALEMRLAEVVAGDRLVNHGILISHLRGALYFPCWAIICK